MDTYTQPVTTKRQYRSLEEKQRIVGEALAEGASVARVARAHGVNANLVFNWCRLYRAGRLRRRSEAKLLPVRVTGESGTPPAASWTEPGGLLATSAGTIHIQLQHAQVRVESGANPDVVACVVGVSAAMIAPPGNTQIWIAAGVTDLRRGFTGLSALVQTKLEQSPFSGQVFIFRGRRGDLVKLIWFDGDGLCLFAKRFRTGTFIWPQATEGSVSLTRAQLSMLLEGIDWRRPERTWDPQLAV